MGQSTSSSQQQTQQQAPQTKVVRVRDVNAKPELSEAEQRKKQHLRLDTPEGIMCSCGYPCGIEHHYNLHIECHCVDLTPIDPSGWPERQFDTVPFVSATQRGVVSKGNIPYAAFSFITIKEDIESSKTVRKAVREAIGQIPILSKEISTKFPDAKVSSLVGITPSLWKLWDPSPPKDIKEFPNKVNSSNPEEILFPRRPGGKYQLLLMVKSERVDLCFELTKQIIAQFGSEDSLISNYSTTQGFAYMAQPPYGGKDLTGFVDGTRNPDHLLRSLVDEVVIFPDDHDNDAEHVGGTYGFAGRFVHDLPKFFAMPLDAKNEVIGRDYSVVRPHLGYDTRPENPRLGGAGKDEYETMDGVPERSHTARAFGAMQRHAYPYYSSSEQGLFFTAYARYLSEIDTALDRMCGKFSEDKSPDNLMSITKAVECLYVYVPSLKELERLTADSNNPYPDLVVEGSGSSATTTTTTTTSNRKDKDKMDVDEEEEEEELPEDVKGPVEGEVRILFEYCTNCGYKSLFVEKKKVLESISPRVKVIGNPRIPRLAAFEIILESDGTVLWSKLSSPNGHNNFPEVFPTNNHLVTTLRAKLGLTGDVGAVGKQGAVYEKGTRTGVW